MSNAKLKEQIEAAKIALVHSAETGAYADTPSTSGTVTQISSMETDNAQPNVDRIASTPRSAAHTGSPTIGLETIAQNEFEKLEVRLQGLEGQIKNQQRDLHTLLQKLRDITTKYQAVAEPKKSKSTKKWLAGASLCMIGLGTIYYLLGDELIAGTIYRVISLMVTLIEALAVKI